MTTTKELTAKDVFITVIAQPCDIDAYSNLGGCMSKKQIKALLEKAESNEWHWCDITVLAEYTDEDGNEFSAETYLGACSYKSRQDFINSKMTITDLATGEITKSGYYDDMVSEVLADLNNQVA